MAAKKQPPAYLSKTSGVDLDAVDRFVSSLQQTNATEPETGKQAGVVRTMGDMAIKAAQGVVGLGQSFVGMGNLATGGLVGQGMNAIGYDPERTNAAMGEYLSDSQKASDKKVQEADGFVDTVAQAVANPRSIFGSVAQSAPGILLGGGMTTAVARRIGAAAAAPLGGLGTQAGGDAAKAAVDAATKQLILAGSAAEGAQSAGQIAEQAQREGRSYGDYALPALGAGALTAGIGYGAGRLMGDATTAAFTGSTKAGLSGSMPVRIAKSMASDGTEETLQSGQEQAMTNLAMGKPIEEGVGNAAGMGLVTGAAMGGGMAAVAGGRQPGVVEPAVDPAKAAADAIRATEMLPASGPLANAVNAGVESKAQAVQAGAPLVNEQSAAEPAPDPVDDPVRDQILALPDGARQDALRAYVVVNRADVAKGVQQYNRKLLDRLLAENAPAPVLGERLTDTDVGSMLGGGGMMGRADPLAGALGMNRATQANSIINVDNAAQARPPIPASDAVRMLDEARNRGLDLVVAEHPSGGFVIVPPAWITPEMADQGQARLMETIGRMQQVDAQPVERAPRTRTGGVDLNLPTDTAQNLGAQAAPVADALAASSRGGEKPVPINTRSEYEAEVRRQLGDLQVGDTLTNDMNDVWTADAVMRNKAGEIIGVLPKEGNPETGEREALSLDVIGSILLPSPVTLLDGTRTMTKAGKVGRAKVAPSAASKAPGATKAVDAPTPSTTRSSSSATALAETLRQREDAADAKSIKESRSDAYARDRLLLTDILGITDTDDGALSYEELVNLLSPTQRSEFLNRRHRANIQRLNSPIVSGVSPASSPTAIDPPPAPTPAQPTASQKPRGVPAKVAAARQARADHFAPGNIVASYGGHDRVESYNPPSADGAWSVTVRAVEKQGDKWVDVPGGHLRTHVTQPSERELKAGPVERAKAKDAPATADPVADRLARAAAQGAVVPSSTDILNPVGQPFKTRMSADRAAKNTPGDVVPVEGGFVVRPQEPVNTQDVPKAPEESQAAQAISPPSQAPQDVGAQPAGAAAGVPAEGVGAVETAGAAPAPTRIGRDQTLLSEGGKPFKTRKAAGDAKKQQPMMRVVTVPGGYALTEKTPAQLAAEAKAAKRLATPRTSARGEPIPAHAFVAAAGGLNPVAASDLGVDGNPRIGNRRLFSGQGRGLSMDQATQMLVADGYLSEGATVNDAFALIKRSLTQPQYNADGIERIAEAESTAQFEDYLAAQEEVAQDDEFDPFGPAPASLDGLTDDALESSGYDAATDAIKAEVRALLEMANAQGIDAESIMLDAHEQTINATEQDYYEAAKSALEAAITGSNQDRGTPAGSEGQGPGAAAASAAEQRLNRPEALDQQALAATENAAPAVSATVDMPPTRQQESSPFAPFATGRYRIAIRDEGNSPYAEVVAIQRGSGVEIEMRMPSEALEHPAFSQLNARAQALFETPTANMFDAEPATLELAAQTPAEAAASQEQAERAEQAQAAAKRAADAAVKAEDERKRIAQASVRAADRFELGQDPMDSLTGQGSVFDVQEPEHQAPKATENVAADAEPESTEAELGKNAASKLAKPITDVGEKIGGARKDTAVSAGTKRRTAKEDDERPTWAKRYKVSQVAGDFDRSVNGKDITGKWLISDTRSKDAYGQPKHMGRKYFDTSEEAEAALPLLAVAQKHRVTTAYERDANGDTRYEIWRDISDRKRVKVVDRQFATREEAMEYMAKNPQEILDANTTFGEADIPKPESTTRKGVERRTVDAEGDDFMQAFGLRGVEFGNWNNQAERQEVMNEAFDGLMDLAEALNLPPKALGLNGDLALAFGARGQGLSGARAHYEPARVVMNLTKMNGAGALAHEWFHALDHYLARQDGSASAEWKVNKDGTRSLDVKGGGGDFASSGFKYANSGVREELRAAYTSLVKSLFSKAEQYVEDTAKADKFVAVSRGELEQQLAKLRTDLSSQLPTYVKRNNKPASAEQLAEFDSIAAELVEGRGLAIEWKTFPGKTVRAIQTRHTNEALEKLGEIYKAVRGRAGFNAEKTGVLNSLSQYMRRYEQRLNMLRDASAETTKTKSVPTSFAMDAKSLDQGRGGDYWTTPHEMAARAFQGYVEDKIAEQGGKSPFLNYAPENAGIITPWGAKRPFPAGDERRAMNAEFDKFVGAIKTKETEGGNVAMFSRTQSGAQSANDQSAANPRRWYDRLVSLLPDAYRGDSYRREPLPSKTGDARASAELRDEIEALNKQLRGGNDRKGYGPVSADDLGNLQVDAGDVDAQEITGPIKALADELGYGIAITGVRSNQAQALKDAGFTPEANLAAIADRLTGRKPQFAQNRYAVQNKGSIFSYKPRGFPMAVFSRTPESLSRADSNTQNVATQMLVDGLKQHWTKAPPIIVARNMQDAQIPQKARDYDAKLQSQGGDGEARAFIYEGKVYLLSDELKSPEDIATALFHEVLGHYGLRGAFGEALTPILNQVATMRKADIAAKAREYGLFDKAALGGMTKAQASDAQVLAAMSEAQKREAAEEVLAEMAQTQPTIGFVKRAIALIRNWLRANVPGFKDLALTDADILQAYILPARGFVTRSQETGTQSLERAMLAFSRGTNESMTNNDVVGNQGGRSADDTTGGVLKNNLKAIPIRLSADEGVVVENGRPVILHPGFGYTSPMQVFSAWLSSHMRKPPETGVFYRFTNNKDEINLLKRGELRNSKNHADDFFEDGLSVADGPHYSIQGYKYGYTLTGDVVGSGSDGEYLLDPKSIKVTSKLRDSLDMAIEGKKLLEAHKEKTWGHLGLSDEVRNAIQSGELFTYPEGIHGDALRKFLVTEAINVRGPFKTKKMVFNRSREEAENLVEEFLANEPTAPDSGGAAFSRTAGDQTQTEAFKKWFGDSKVVDAEGKPLVVYHGTASDITEFDDRSVYEGGIYFTANPRYATGRAYIAERMERGPAANVMPAFVRIVNPAPASMSVAQAKREGHDGIIRDNEVVAFKPEQIKSATGNNGDFDPTNPDIRFGRTKAVGDAIKSVADTNLKQKAGFKATDYLGIGLQTLGRRQIVDIYGDALPLDQYNKLVQQMEADKNEGGAEADQLVTQWAKLPDEGKLADLMHDATLAQIDPSVGFVDGDDKGQYLSLQRKYNLLSGDAKKVYADTRDAYKAHHAKVRSAIKERIERSELKGPRKAELLSQMDGEFFKAVKGVYFPLARFGQYAVTVKEADGKVESVSRAETKAEAEALRSNLLSAFPTSKGFTVGRVMLSKDFIADRDAVGRGFMTELYQALDKQDMDAAQRAELEDTLGQLYLSSLPDLSWAKHGIHRKGTPGFSQDARRAFAQNMFHGSRYLAKLRYSDLMQDELTAMQKHVDDWREVPDYDQNSAQRVVDEMNKRHESLMNPKSSALSTALTSFGFVFHLGLSPASALVNLSQTALVAYPIMGAKWGFGKASAALLKASAEATKGKNDITGALNADERAAYDEAVRAGTIDVTMAHDLAGIAQGEDAGVMWKIRPVMRWASFLFHHAERFNRQVTFVAAYRLAREAGADSKVAFEQATKATYDGHFDYGAANRPRLMQGNVAKVVLLFKQYGQNMVYTLARNAQQAIKAETPEAREQARKALAGLLVTHASAAGVLGLPMVTTLLAAASMIGGDDDEPWDAQVALQNMLADTFGQKTAEVMSRGLSRLTPWDISGRVGLDKLIFPDIQEGLEGQRLGESAMAAALGPVAGIGINVLKGLQDISRGQYERGLESMMPAALRGPIKSMRYQTEGVQDKTGIVIKDEVSAAGVAGQFLGFSPSEVRNATEGKSAVYQQDRALGDRRQELMNKAARATMDKDAGARTEAMQEIAQFNQKHPARRITPLNVLQSVRNRQKRIDQADGGVYLPKNRRDAMEAGRFAAAE